MVRQVRVGDRVEVRSLRCVGRRFGAQVLGPELLGEDVLGPELLGGAVLGHELLGGLARATVPRRPAPGLADGRCSPAAGVAERAAPAGRCGGRCSAARLAAATLIAVARVAVAAGRAFRGRRRLQDPGPVELDVGVVLLEEADRGLRRWARGRRARPAACGTSRGAACRAPAPAALDQGGRFIAAPIAVEAQVWQGLLPLGFLRAAPAFFFGAALAGRALSRPSSPPGRARLRLGTLAAPDAPAPLAARAAGRRRAGFGRAVDQREPGLVADRVVAPDLGDRHLVFGRTAAGRCRPAAAGTYRWKGARARPKWAHCAIASRWLTDSAVSTSISPSSL